MLKNFIKKNYYDIIISFIIFVFLGALFYMFPYNSDDWGKKSLNFLSSIKNSVYLWKTYNGRFFGNILVCLFKYSDIFKSIFSSLVMLTLITVLSKYIKINKFQSILLSFLLLILMPLSMFKDTISWMSSFANFVIPGLCIAEIIYISKDIFNKEAKIEYKWYHYVIAILCGIFMNLFTEHNSIFSVLLAVGIIGASYLIRKEVYKLQLVFLFTSIAFCALTFLSPVYWGNMPRLTNADFFVNMGFIDKIIYNLKNTIWLDSLSYENIVLNFIIGILFVLNIKKVKNKYAQLLIIALSLITFIIYPFLYFNPLNFIFSTKIKLLIFLIYVYVIIHLLYKLFYQKDKNQFFMLLCLFLSAFIVALPLLVSYRIGPRCFFSSYVILIIFTYLLANNLFVIKPKIINILIIIGSLSLSVILGYVAYKNYLNKLEISEIINFKIKIKDYNIILPSYPYPQIIRQKGKPTNEEQYNSFLKYYHLNNSYTVYFVSYYKYYHSLENKYFSNFIVTTTYDGSNQATHPSIVNLNKKVSGYKYWLTLTPLPNDNPRYENPSILASNSGTHWIVPNGLSNPVACTTKNHIKDYCSDPYLFYNNGQFELWYRFNPYIYGKVESKKYNCLIYRKTSKDGINWSKEELIFDKEDNQAFMSMSIIYENNKYKIWYVNYDGNIYYRESNDLKKWTSPIKVEINNFTKIVWHGEIIREDNSYYYLAYLQNGELCLMKSNNGLNFETIKNIDISFVKTEENSRVYKSTIMKVDDKIYLYIPYNKKINGKSHWSIYLKIYDKKDFYK